MTKPTDHWCTPGWLADAIGAFDLDPCSNPDSLLNAELAVYEGDSPGGIQSITNASFSTTIYANPPYSNMLPWANALTGGRHDAIVLCKLDPTTKWWACFAEKSYYWTPFFFRKRIKFRGASTVANFPSAIWASGNWGCRTAHRLVEMGHCWGQMKWD